MGSMKEVSGLLATSWLDMVGHLACLKCDPYRHHEQSLCAAVYDTCAPTALSSSSDLCVVMYMGSCQEYGPFLDPYYNTAPNI